MLIETLEQAAPLGALVIATVAALRARLPALDGWVVLPVAALLSLGIAAGIALPWSDPIAYAELAVCTWLIAIGVPAAAVKAISHAATKRTVIVEASKPKE